MARDDSRAALAHSFEIQTPVKSFVVRAANDAEKREWIDAILFTKSALVKNAATLKPAAKRQGPLTSGGSSSATLPPGWKCP